VEAYSARQAVEVAATSGRRNIRRQPGVPRSPYGRSMVGFAISAGPVRHEAGERLLEPGVHDGHHRGLGCDPAHVGPYVVRHRAPFRAVVRASGYIARTCVVVSQLRERDLVGGTFTVDPRQPRASARAKHRHRRHGRRSRPRRHRDLDFCRAGSTQEQVKALERSGPLRCGCRPAHNGRSAPRIQPRSIHHMETAPAPAR
jgi:hypothetical protein